MHRVLGFVGFVGILGFFSTTTIPAANAASSLTYRYQHFLFTINPAEHREWRSPKETWTMNGIAFTPPAQWRVDGDTVPPLPAGVQRQEAFAWNRSAIRSTLQKVIGAALERPAGRVAIRRNEKNEVMFDGVGLTGRAVDFDQAVSLTMRALEENLTDISLPVTETQPDILVDDVELLTQGITEVVTIGESEFTGSPVNRRFNIGVGLSKFNGTLIPAGAVFSFNTVLGKVDGSTGYRKELVIKGDRTEPDYGGGLCQISTTAYRGVWEYGFPILKRKNHSYSVRYYFPSGTDATVYPGSVDMVFHNDLASALLIQTHQENNRAYFIYYGTRDTRLAEIFGPFIYDRTAPPPDKIELTTDLPPGEKKKLNERVPGLKAQWYRYVQPVAGSGAVEPVYSHYEARPLFTAVGVAELPPGYSPKGGDTATFTEDTTDPGPAVPSEESSASSFTRARPVTLPVKPSTRRRVQP